MISENDFDEQYVPIDVSRHGDRMAPTYGDALAFAESQALSERHIWAITEGDEDESLFANPGPHCVNVIGYAVTQSPWKTGDEVAVYFEGDSDDLAPGPGM